MTDPALPNARPESIAVRDSALTILGYDLSIFNRLKDGGLRRGRDDEIAKERARVWREMRTALSFPQIARSCGMKSHSTIVESVYRLERREHEERKRGAK